MLQVGGVQRLPVRRRFPDSMVLEIESLNGVGRRAGWVRGRLRSSRVVWLGWTFLESWVAALGTTMVNRDRMMMGHLARDRRVLEGMMVVIQWFGLTRE